MEKASKGVKSAQVVLRSASTTEAQAVSKAFKEAGFEVGAKVANNFSITAPAETFESYFGVELRPSEAIPLNSVPASIRKYIESIVIPAKPDFGPWGNY